MRDERTIKLLGASGKNQSLRDVLKLLKRNIG
jgi:hypothetical protein